MEKQLMSVEKPSFFMENHFWSWQGMSFKPQYVSRLFPFTLVFLKT
jgi:hypothetical protein